MFIVRGFHLMSNLNSSYIKEDYLTSVTVEKLILSISIITS